MSLWKYTQRTFNGGVLDRELMGRQDLSKYFCGASLLKNFVVRRQGNLAKRRGTELVAELANLLGHRRSDDGSTVYDAVGKSRLIPIVNERESGYYALLCGKRAFLVDRNMGIRHSDGSWKRSVDDYLFVPNKSSQRILGDAVCEIDGILFASFADAVSSMKDGETIKLLDDVEIANTFSIKGYVDLNGNDIVVKSATAQFKFGNTADRWYGVVNRNFIEGGSITWDVSPLANNATPYNVNTEFFVQDKPGNLQIQHVRVVYPFVGAGAFVFSSPAGKGGVYISSCSISAQCRIANIKGDDASGNSDVIIYNDSHIESTYSHGSNAAFTHGSSNANNRKIRLRYGSIDVPSCPVATYGFRLDGGRCRCGGFGKEGSTLGYNKASEGLVNISLSSDQILQGSELKKDTEKVGEVTYYRYVIKEAAIMSAPMSTSSVGTSSFQESEPVIPYFVEVPYEDGDLADLDVFQSGDTIFLAHKGYAPAKLVFDHSFNTLSYEMIEFNATTWKRPVITKCTNKVNINKSEPSYSGSTGYKTETTYNVASGTRTVSCYKGTDKELISSATTNLQKRTVSYCVTYVKDGVESAPSNPISVTYIAPWESGGKVTVEFSKGLNDTEPDYYNVYKKESTEYGLIGSTSKTGVIDAIPEMFGKRGLSVAYSTTPIATAYFNGYGMKDVFDTDILGAREENAVTNAASSVSGTLGSYDVYRGVGGVRFGSNCSAVFSFGGNSGLSIGKVKVCFDSHTLRYVEDDATGKVKVYDDMWLSGKTVSVTVTYSDKDGTGNAFVKTTDPVTLDGVSYTPEGGTQKTAYSGFVSHYCGSVDPGASYDEISNIVNRSVRSAEFTLSGGSGGTAWVVDGTKQVDKIEISCVDDVESVSQDVSCFLCGIEFYNAEATEKYYEDDYITPDMSVTPPSDDTEFRGRGNYPSCVGLYQQRLIFAATSDQPFGFWMSAVGNLYNFAPHSSIREDDAIEAELAATEFPNINHIVMNRDIIMLGDGGEWKIAPVTGNTITYKTISAELQSSIGSAKWIKPLTVGKEIIFAERNGMTLRSIVYNFSSDGYESTDLSVLSGNLFADNRIERMCYKQHPDSTIECVLADGTVAVLVYMPEHEVAAWSRCVLGGGYCATDIATSKALNGNTTDVMLTVKNGSATELWTVRPDLPEITVDAQTCMDRIVRKTASEASSEWKTGWAAVDLETGAVVTSSAGLFLGRNYICGYPFEAEYVSVRPEPSGNETIQFEIKNARSAEVRVVDSGRFSVRGYDVSPERETAVSTGFSMAGGVHSEKDFDVVLCGKNTRDGRVSIKSTDPLPCNILSVSVTYQIEASDQNGRGE